MTSTLKFNQHWGGVVRISRPADSAKRGQEVQGYWSINVCKYTHDTCPTNTFTQTHCLSGSPQEIYLDLDCSLEITRPSTIFPLSHTVGKHSALWTQSVTPYVYLLHKTYGFMLSPWSHNKESQFPLYIIKRYCHYFDDFSQALF